MLDAIADWIDADSAPRANGAEDEYYAQRAITALAANAPLVRVAEFTSVRGASAKAWAALAPDIAALPAGTTLNINTSNADVIGCRDSRSHRRQARELHRGPRAQALHDDGGAARALASQA